MKEWIIEGKFTSGPGSEWERLDDVTESDPEGSKPGDLTGYAYAKWLANEYRMAHAPAPIRIRPKPATT